jgi:glycosyltransferase involved in cell wall biosynthesis
LSEAGTLRSLHRLESRLLDEDAWGGLQGDLQRGLWREDKLGEGLTIVIPNWNHRLYLPRAIRSALQGLTRLQEEGLSGEIIVIDDASRDGSQKLLRSIQMLYAESRLKTLFLPRNLGLPRVRNLGLQMSTYRHVCLMDADNELVADNLPLFLQSIIETDAALVHGNLLYKEGEQIVQLLSGRVANLRLTDRNYIDAFALVEATELLKLGGFVSDPRLYGYEDWEMLLNLIFEEKKVVFVPAAMGYYYRNPRSMLEETVQTSEEQKARTPAAETESLVWRMFAQSGSREWDPMQVGHIYHPAVGYIDQC